MGISGEEREKRMEGLFQESIAKNFPNLRKKLDIQVQEANRASYNPNARRPPRHIILKSSNVNDKEF